MSVSTAIAIYFIIWWVVLFAVLPFGVHSQQESGAVARGTDPGAPTVPRLRSKLLWTTLVAAIVFAIWQLAYSYRLVEKLARMLTLP
jgi:predicted secreted protein